MLTRLRMVWVTVRDSLWFIPAVLTLSTSALAILLVRLEAAGAIGVDTRSWLLASGAEGARGVLATIAGGLITVTGVVFSVTIVALQLASSQFTPRLLRNFTADRSNQIVLGIFIATFTYTLLVLRTIESQADDREAFVPRIAVAISLLLVLVSIVSLIYFINHAARSIQVSVILDRVTRLTLHHIDTVFPLPFEADAEGGAAERRARQETQLLPVVAERSGYLQAVDARTLFETGRRARVAIEMERFIGDFIIEGQVLAWVDPCDPLDAKTLDEIRDAFILGPGRTFEQDVEFGIIEIADIAVKALSPGINDPTTALTCIDRLGQILRTFGARRAEPPIQGDEGRVHFTPRFTTFERAVDLAFDQIRHYGSGNPTVARKILDVLGSLESLLPEPRRGPLRHQAMLVRAAAQKSGLHERELASLDRVIRRPRAASREDDRDGNRAPSGTDVAIAGPDPQHRETTDSQTPTTDD